MRCLPSLRRVAGQKLIRDDLVHQDVQPGAERLAADHHLVITAERMGQFGVYRLNREGELGLVREAQQFPVQSRGNRR